MVKLEFLNGCGVHIGAAINSIVILMIGGWGRAMVFSYQSIPPQRCILQSQADIIKNTRKAMKDVEVDRDVLKKKKAKLEQVVDELLKDGYGSKEKLEQIKAILES